MTPTAETAPYRGDKPVVRCVDNDNFTESYVIDQTMHKYPSLKLASEIVALWGDSHALKENPPPGMNWKPSSSPKSHKAVRICK